MAIAGVLAWHGCGSECLLSAELVCCNEWAPGSDMTNAYWGNLAEDERMRFGALMQGAGDLSIHTARRVIELGASCETLALELGQSPPGLTEEVAFSPNERTRATCAAAARGIEALRAQGVTVALGDAHCGIWPAAQIPCETACLADPSCDTTLADLGARCPEGSLVGSCPGVCTTNVDGSGSGCCSGTCEGSPDVPVESRGVCDGTCDGACEGSCALTDDAGRCRGRCDGTCDGRCAGPSQVDGSEGSFCGGVCVGTCSAEGFVPTCRAQLTPRKGACEGPPECMAGCRASAAALAQCPSATLTIDAGPAPDAVSAARLGALRSLLPPIVTTARARAALLRENIEGLLPRVAVPSTVAGSPTLASTQDQCKMLASRSLADALADAATLEAAAGEVLTASGG